MSTVLSPRTHRRLRIAVFVLTAGMVAYLALVAAFPWILSHLPAGLSWFGKPGSIPTIVIACATIALACTLAWRHGFGRRSVGGPLGITIALTILSFILAFGSYLWCHDNVHPPVVTALLWAGDLIKGGIDDHRFYPSWTLCPAHAPVAIDIARVTTMAAILIGVAGIAIALLQSRLDRIRVRFDPSITAVVGADGEADSMLSAIARTLEHNSHLVIVTSFDDAQRRAELRRAGHRILAVDFDKPDALTSLPIWTRLSRLYLLSSDPVTNLQRLKSITRCLPAGRNRRLPLTVRIDDPWQAEAWRAQQLGGSDQRWAADTVGKYEVTAQRLLDTVIDDELATKIVICGTTPLTLAVCANLVRRRLERNFYSEPSDTPAPSLVIVGEDAEEYRRDEKFHLAQRGLESAQDWMTAVAQPPSVSCLIPLLTPESGGEPVDAAVIITEAPCDPMLGTLLAGHFPSLPIYAYSHDATELPDVASIVGRLHTFRLTMELPPGHSLDVWERAAMLIHNRYVTEFPSSSPAARPWAQLDDFYRGSNRRQVRNALWMVEQIAGHTWDTFGISNDAPSGPSTQLNPLERLARMGIDRDAALAMAEAEHHDWCRYYRQAGWRYGPVRDDARKIHDGLVSWKTVASDPDALNRALTSLDSTLSALRELGYRSRPMWQRFRRTGTVNAEQRTEPWSWTSASGQPMRAEAGDWAVSGHAGGQPWSVRDDIFRSTHEHVDGNTWRRCGVVKARKARGEEVIQTLEGPLTAEPGDWIVQGSHGEQWPVDPDTFKQQYQGPLSEAAPGGVDFTGVKK